MEDQQLNRIRLRLLGGFEIESAGGRNLPELGRKVKALLAYLALQEHRSSRDKVADLLWSDREGEHARNSLRQALVSIRRISELSGLVETSRDHLWLWPDCYSVDVETLRLASNSIHPADWLAGADAYKGDFLDGFFVRDPVFEEWSANTREKLRQTACALLTRIATQGPEEAREHAAERLVSIDPLSEASHRVLIATLMQAGKASEARQALERCRSMLRTEFGEEPSEQTIRMLDRVSAELHLEVRGGQVSTDSTKRDVKAHPLLLAVLPFEHEASDTDRLLADGLTDETARELSRFRYFSVLASDSSIALREQAIGARELHQQFGIEYAVKGSVRRDATRVRVNVQLLEASAGSVVWMQRYDRALGDLFDLQDELSLRIATALVRNIELDVASRASRKKPENFEAYECLLRGIDHHMRMNAEDVALGKKLFERALELDPSYAEAHGWLSLAYNVEWTHDLVPEKLTTALQLAKKAVDLDPGSGRCHMILGMAYQFLGDQAKADRHYAKAVELNPGDHNVAAQIALNHAYKGELEESRQWFARAVTHNPFPAIYYHFYEGIIEFQNRRYQEALESFKSHAIFPADFMYAAACCGHLGDTEQAAKMLVRLNAILPNYSAYDVGEAEPILRPEDRQHLREGLLKACAK